MKKGIVMLSAVLILLTGCGTKSEVSGTQNSSGSIEAASEIENTNSLTVRFGDEGSEFSMHLYDNETANTILGFAEEQSWRLPIYHFDDYDNWEVMQFYDIPESYEIPSDSQHITEEKGGEVYYCEPNRIVLFYKDTQVEGDYTPVGYFDYSEEFVKAVEENPVLEGWGNKIVLIEK